MGTREFPHQGCRAIARVRPPQKGFQHHLRGRPHVADLMVQLLLPLPLQAFQPPWPSFPKALLTPPAREASLWRVQESKPGRA